MSRMIATTLLLGLALGGAGMSALHAQGQKKPAWVIAEVEVTDPPAFQAYGGKVPPTLKPFNGRVIANAKPDVMEGESSKGNFVVVAFDSVDDAQKWYASAAYQPLIPERQKAAKTRLLIVEGLPPQ
jgi:uncharacterized protein (DUF1330 family)